MTPLVELLGRIFLALVFLGSALSQITEFAATEDYMAAQGMPAPGWFLVGAISLELFGGLCLVLGYRVRAAAVALIVFLVPATLIFHFDVANQEQMVHTMKNLAILGGLLVVASHGSGSVSLDRHLHGEASSRSGFADLPHRGRAKHG